MIEIKGLYKQYQDIEVLKDVRRGNLRSNRKKWCGEIHIIEMFKWIRGI